MTFLPRLQLVELMDLDWFPRWLRRWETDFILLSWRQFAPKKEIVRQLASLVASSPSRTIVDLCSGSGGLVTAIFEEVRQQSNTELALMLTDAFPNPEAQLGDGITYEPEPVDASAIDRRLTGVRTMFAGLHHFPPQAARQVLLDAKRSRQPIAVYELTPRSLWCLILVVFNAMLGTLLFTPFVRPFSWGRLVFTYLLPLLPFAILFDGLVSVLRTYTPEEMLELAETDRDRSYEWRSGRIRRFPTSVVYLLGRPRADSAPTASEAALEVTPSPT